VEKHRSNPQHFKEKKLQSEIFNQLKIKKVKLTKRILKKKTKKEEKRETKNKKCKKKYKEVEKKGNAWVWVNNEFPTPFSLLLNLKNTIKIK